MAVIVMEESRALGCYSAEPCCVCRSPTRFWFLPKDVALCQRCAGTHDAKDLPTKREWLNQYGANLPEDWTCHVDRHPVNAKGQKKRNPAPAHA